MSVNGLMAHASNRVNQPRMLGLLEHLANEKGWDEDEGCTYALFKDPHAVGLWDAPQEEFGIVLVDVNGVLRPHFHRRCDVILVAHLFDGARGEAYVDKVGKVPINSGQTFVINRNEVHAFRKVNGAGRLLLVNIESPELEDDDTEYVDIPF